MVTRPISVEQAVGVIVVAVARFPRARLSLQGSSLDGGAGLKHSMRTRSFSDGARGR